MKRVLISLLIVCLLITACYKKDTRGFGLYSLIDSKDTDLQQRLEKLTGNSVSVGSLGETAPPAIYTSAILLEQETFDIEVWTAPYTEPFDTADHSRVYEIDLYWQSEESPSETQMDHFAAMYHRMVEDFGRPENVCVEEGRYTFKDQLERFEEENRGNVYNGPGFYASWSTSVRDADSPIGVRVEGPYMIQYTLTWSAQVYSLHIIFSSMEYLNKSMQRMTPADQLNEGSSQNFNHRGAFGNPPLETF